MVADEAGMREGEDQATALTKVRGVISIVSFLVGAIVVLVSIGGMVFGSIYHWLVILTGSFPFAVVSIAGFGLSDEASKKGPPAVSGKVLKNAGSVFQCLGVLTMLTGVGGMLFGSLSRWFEVLTGGLAAGLLGAVLMGLSLTAEPTRARRSPGSAAGLLVRRLILVIAALGLAASFPVFLLHLAGFFGAYNTEAHGAALVTVTITGDCTLSQERPAPATTDRVTCPGSWGVGGQAVTGTLRGTYGELGGNGPGVNGHPSHADSARAYVSGTNAYTPKVAHRREPGDTAPLDALPGWTWLGLPLSVVALSVVVSNAWTPLPKR